MSVSADPIVQEERKHGLYEVSVLGVSPWRLIRIPIIEEILVGQRGLGRSNQNRVSMRRIPWMALGVARSFVHLFRLRRRPYLFLGFPRRRLEDGLWVDPFSDPLIECTGSDETLCIEKPFGGEHDLPQRTRDILHYDWVSALSLAASWLLVGVPMLAYGAKLRQLADKVTQLGPVNRRRVRLLASRTLVAFWVERFVASFLLGVIRPRVVLLTMRRQHLPMIHACKSRGIKVYELQHGAMATGGFKYSTPHDPSLDPDLFLSFGEYWNASDWGLPAKAVTAIGFKFIDDKKTRHERLEDAAARGKKVMLVSQPHIWRLLDPFFGAMVKGFPQQRFVFKLHPQDVDRWWDRYPSMGAPNVEVIAGTTPDLYDLFRECQCVCGYDSTVLFEAAFLGVKTGVINPHGHNPCSALQYVGQFNFHELREAEDLGDLLAAGRARETGNPFFAPFDGERFMTLLKAAA